jgi:hypothetical protein
MGAATKGRSTGKRDSSKSTKTGTSRGAARTATQERAEGIEHDRDTGAAVEGNTVHETNGVATVGDAIVEPAASSQEAAEQRQAVNAPAVVGGEASAQQADEAKAIALPEVPVTPATNPGLEQLAMEESRQRADVVAQHARAQQYTSGVGAGTVEPDKAQVRTYARLQQAKAPEPENVVEHKEVAIPAADGRELVFRQNFGGFVEVLWNDPARINALRGGGPESMVATLSPEQWAALGELDGDGGTGSAPEGQSAAEQRAGVAQAGQGGDPGPAAPLPVFAR